MQPGDRLGPYEIVAPLGVGGMGEVYRARDTRLEREVAVKVLPERLAADPQALARFEREAKAVAALSHPNILALYDIGSEGGVSYAVTELLEGETLRQRMTGALPASKAIEIAAAVAEGLAAAHSKGVIHRDIKPENIFLTSDGRVKILDFGLARRESAGDPQAETVTEPGTVMGTIGYMSPEQVRSEKAEATSDIFSLGCMIYEMISGQRPFARKTTAETMAAILNNDPPALPGAAPELELVVRRCLEKNPGERFQSARDLAFALKSVGSRRSQVGWKPLVGMAALVAVAAAIGGYWLLRPARMIESIAILPFAGAAGDTEYLSDGLTESLINSLSRVSGLKVMSRSAVFRYKGKDPDPQAVARDLKVRAVLTGRLVQRGENLTISAELVDTRDASHLWGEQYTRKLADLQGVQEEIAREIAEKLRLRITGEQQKSLARRQTPNSEAYQDYLRGRYFWNRRTGESLNTAIGHFNQAIAKDPTFALAYAGLADCWVLMSFYTPTPSRECYPKAKAAALAALKIDDTLAEAHAVLGRTDHMYAWNWTGAERGFRKALELNPKYATAHQWYGQYLYSMRRDEEAFAEMRRAQDLDPLSLIISTILGDLLLERHRYDEALEEYRRAFAMDPNFAWARYGLGKVYVSKLMYSEAIAEFQAALKLQEKDARILASLGNAYAVSGDQGEARRILAELMARSKLGYVSPEAFAVVYAGLGDKDRAFEWLRKAVDERAATLFLYVGPVFDRLQSDPRYAELLRRMNLPASPP